MAINHLGIVVADIENWTAGVFKESSCLIDGVQSVWKLYTRTRIRDSSASRDYGRVTQIIRNVFCR